MSTTMEQSSFEKDEENEHFKDESVGDPNLLSGSHLTGLRRAERKQ